jgi:hypothetical protein
VGGAETTPASTIREFGGNKFPLLVQAGHTVTVAISEGARRSSGLAYDPARQERVRRRAPHHTVTRKTPRTVTFVACRRSNVRPGSSANGAVTFWSGFVPTSAPRCVPLEIYVDDQPSPRRQRSPSGPLPGLQRVAAFKQTQRANVVPAAEPIKAPVDGYRPPTWE